METRPDCVSAPALDFQADVYPHDREAADTSHTAFSNPKHRWDDQNILTRRPPGRELRRPDHKNRP